MNIEFAEGGLFTQLLIVVGVHAVWVETQHVSIGYAVGDGVFVQHVTEERARGDFILGVLLKDRRTSEAKQQGTWEGALDVHQHLTKNRAVAFVDDEYQAFLADTFYQGCVDAGSGFDVRHLLD